MAYNQIYVPKDTQANKPSNEAKPAEPQSQQAQEPSGDNVSPANPEDLLSQVAQFEAENKPNGKSEADIDAEVFSDPELRAKIDSISDPALKEQFIAMRKSMIRGLNQKFEDLAGQRKELAAFGDSSKPKFAANSIEELLQNPDFVKEAQRMTGQADALANDETTSPEAKQEIAKVKSELEAFKQRAIEEQARQHNLAWQNQHLELSKKYKNYDKSAVDSLANDLVNNKVQVTPEALYKVLYHDDNIRRAYELGRRSTAESTAEKREISSINGITPVQNDGVVQEKGEDNKAFMLRIINNRMAQKK